MTYSLHDVGVVVTNGIPIHHENQKIVKILSGLIISNSTVYAQSFAKNWKSSKGKFSEVWSEATLNFSKKQNFSFVKFLPLLKKFTNIVFENFKIL